MNNLLFVIFIILSVEIIGHLVFIIISKWNKHKNHNKIDFRSILKGVLERVFITFVITINLPNALTVFAALKIATRIKDDSKISNDFYLIGNIISLSMAILYSVVINQELNY